MLVLSRKVDERIVITVPPSDKPTQIIITAVEFRGDKVRIGIDAPSDVLVLRDELEPREQPAACSMEVVVPVAAIEEVAELRQSA